MSEVRSEAMSQEKTLIFICDYAADYAGNFIRSLIRLAEAYDGRVAYAFPERAAEKRWASLLPTESVRFVSFSGRQFGADCEQLLAEFGNECLVHVHFCDDMRLLEIKRRFRHIVCHVHMADEAPVKLKSRLRKMAEQPLRSLLYGRMYRGIKLVGVSRPVAESVKRRYPEADVACVPNAIDFSRFRGCTVPERPLNGHGLSALVFGTHFYRKAADVAMEACGRLVSEGLGIELTVPAHSVVKCSREVRSARGGVPSWVKVVRVSEDVGLLYAQADCFLSPSRSEAFGYAVVEAAYMGCRVIASDVPGQSSLKDVPGIAWIPADDAASLARAIAESRDWLSARSEADFQNTRAYLEEHYGIERWVEGMLAVYESVIG